MNLSIAEFVHHHISVPLGQIAVQSFRLITQFLQRFRDFIDTALSAAEYGPLKTD